MPESNRIKLKQYFEKGDRPTQEQFYEFIDSGLNKPDDQIFVTGLLGSDTQIGLGGVPALDGDPGQAQVKLHVYGRIRAEGLKIPAPNVEGKLLMADQFGNANWANQNQIDDGDWMIDGNLLYTHNQAWNVGIGTNNPTLKLDVRGNIQAKTDQAMVKVESETNWAWAKSSLLFTNENTDQEWSMSMQLDGNSGVNQGRKSTFFLRRKNPNLPQNNWLDYLTIDQNTNSLTFDSQFPGNPPSEPTGNFLFQHGKVGIQQNNPQHPLHVEGTALVKGFYLQDGTQGVGKVLLSDANGHASWANQTALNDGDWQISGNNMCSMPGGNVGIGTTNPKNKLSVQGHADVTTNGASTFFSVANENPAFASQTVSSIIQLNNTNAKDYFEILETTSLDANGNPLPVFRLRKVIKNANGQPSWQHDFLQYYSHLGNSTQYFLLSAKNPADNSKGKILFFEGNVGIDTWDPQKKLTVNGDIGLEGGSFLVKVGSNWKKPFFVKRFPLSQRNRNDPYHNGVSDEDIRTGFMDDNWRAYTGIFHDEFHGAAIAGFQFGDYRPGNEKSDYHIKMTLEWNNTLNKNEWVVIANFGNTKNAIDDPEENWWKVSVLFIRKEFVEAESYP
ncbi:MAG: hypothetical protein H6581_24985 [Bacteroidia bacterium]|nr:hypothetical protein [Bacteroidia bacterium]